MLREGCGEALIGHPDHAMGVGCQLRCLGMRLLAIEDLRHGLSLRRCERSNKGQATHAVIGAGRDHCARIGMSTQHDRTCGAFQGALERLHVSLQGSERNRRGDHPYAPSLQRLYDTAPTGAVGPRTMDQHHTDTVAGLTHRRSTSFLVTYSPRPARL